ncbi:CDP-glycerol glycerophosphotransferase family protein [Domibacillus sp. PGB-M46]|uniref:CDP-glycerol glycerophosphotransferase family protein n=1 Tax=Domibacillus sp. PGB-M46 TaxID=2910255 RepID=UPI001F58BCD5|nr:CDP-glycerol glycerophosphotransferase family protein [Domibacillus sp. PGB-M46]MCI2255200.1 CDP-glycerol glycerophosphotransferase family protein [Domibacillus sp. PGB-M46]
MSSRMKKLVSLLLIYVFNCFPIKNNKIFLFSYYGSQYGCNPKYITDYIVRHYPKNQFDLVWSFNDIDTKKELYGFRKVKTMSLRYFYELCTAKVVITNFRTTDLYVKRKNQYYIQTWHSSLRLKQIEKDAETSLPAHYVKMAKEDSKKCDLLLSGCKYSTDIFKKSFWYDGEIFEYGSPRNDLLFQNNKNKRAEVLKKLHVPPGKKIVLYAPTFRKNNSTDVYDLNYAEINEKLKNKFGGEWVVFVKLHPHLINQTNEFTHGEHVLDVTKYDDIQELLLVADILISDYSSLMFDFSITKRPCFLYVPDVKEYVKQDRALYFDLMELPFSKSMSKEGLLEEIDKFHYETYKQQLLRFSTRIGSFEEGKACEYLVNRINQVCFSKKRSEINEAV